MLNESCTSTAVLLTITGFTDGEEQYQESSVNVVPLNHEEMTVDGKKICRNVFLIAPPALPTLPGKLRFNAVTYDLAEVQICRDLDGVLIGSKVTVLN
ncbi:MAG: hypothetical protein PHS41_08395 [Victivallaceae bacterium]|nr:hypothetical protein [Victivallaceae bacterium]